jgi:1-pyrroline-4-hydroxy-2-carboxylate deaminase
MTTPAQPWHGVLVATALPLREQPGILTVELWAAASNGDLARALPLYRLLHPLLRWDSRTEFVQAIKLSMDLAGRYGGPCRQPRVPLTPEQEKAVRVATERAIAEGLT